MNNREKTGIQIWRMIYPLLIFFGLDIFLETVVMYGYIFFRGIDGGLSVENITELIEDSTRFLLSVSIYLTLARSAILVPIFLVLMRADRKRDVQYGRPVKFTSFNPAYYFVIILLGAAAAIGINYVVSMGAGMLQEFLNIIIKTLTGRENVIDLFAAFNDVADIIYSGGIVIQILATAVAAPLVEELLFRGLIYKRIRVLVKPVWAAVISAAIFGLAHGNFIQFVYAFILGLLFASVYEKFKTIWIPVALHAGANLVSVVITNVVPEDYEFSVGILLAVVAATLIISAALVYYVHKTVKVEPVNNNSEV